MVPELGNLDYTCFGVLNHLKYLLRSAFFLYLIMGEINTAQRDLHLFLSTLNLKDIFLLKFYLKLKFL